MQYADTLQRGALTRKLDAAIAMKSPQTSIIKAELGEDRAGAMIVSGIREACLLTGSDVKPELQVMIAKTLLNDYWHFKMDEIMFVLAEGVKGRWAEPGKPAIYGQLNLPTIHQWMQRYDMEKLRQIEDAHESNKGAWGNQADRSPAPRLAKDIFSEAVDNKVEQRIKAYRRKAEESEGENV